VADPVEDYFSDVCLRAVEALRGRYARDRATWRTAWFTESRVYWFVWNCARDEWKSRNREERRRREAVQFADVPFDEEPQHATSPVQAALTAEDNAIIRRCVGKLPERQKQMVQWYFLECLSIPDIAERLGIHKSTVSRAMQEARPVLESCLAEHGLRPGDGQHGQR
jgi:RNA polymerase sigma factor (sigma-70 family)